MGKKEKKEKRAQAQPPVITGKDKRAEKRDGAKGYTQSSDAPDGVSGNWS